MGNPMTELLRYRQTVIAMLAQFAKLDDERIGAVQPDCRYRPPVPRHDRMRKDRAELSAVLALLQELSPESLRVVLRATVDLQK
jgi:hypothetical protein